MKKIFLVLALIATVQFANAQKPEALKKAVEKAEIEAQNPKKATKAATWLKLADAYVKAYDAPAGNIWIGASQQELNIALAGQRPVGQEQVGNFVKLIYPDKDVYLNEAGTVAFYEVTKPLVENALEKAIDAYKKAYELEPKKSEEIKTALQNITGKYCNDANSMYYKGDYKLACDFFEKAAEASENEPLAAKDTNSIYNAALCAVTIPDLARAKGLYEKCYNMGYYSENGDVFSRLSDINMQMGDTLKAKSYLEEGFTKFPKSQGILIGLINYYIGSGEGTDKLFELIEKAKANEPNNASLYYVEGNIHAKLGDTEKACIAYDKCAEINPEYEYGYIGKGVMFYDLAIEIQTKAQDELDDNKYMELVKKFEDALKSCIDPFVKAFETTKDESIKPTLAEYLKNAYFRFREESPEYQAGYEKFDKIARGE